MFCSISKVEHMATVLHLPAILDGYCLPFFISNNKVILNSNQCVVFMGFMEASHNSVLVSAAISTLRLSQELEIWEAEIICQLSAVKPPTPFLSPSHDREWSVKGKYFCQNDPPNSEITFTYVIFQGMVVNLLSFWGAEVNNRS